VLRDEGEAYARKLISVGLPVTAMRYLGTIRDFVMLNGLRSKLGLCALAGRASREHSPMR
jgi:acetyl esterase